VLSGLLRNFNEIFGQLNPAYVPSQVRAYMQIADLDTGEPIAGLTYIPITHLSMRFPLRGIPTCDVILASGYNAETGDLADIYKLFDSVTQGDGTKFRIYVYMRMYGMESATRKWPDHDFKVWDGISVGPGYTRSRGNTSLTIHSAHWISELDHATVLSDALHAGSCDDYIRTAASATSSGMVDFVGKHTLVKAARDSGFRDFDTDLWNEVTLPMLVFLTGYRAEFTERIMERLKKDQSLDDAWKNTGQIQTVWLDQSTLKCRVEGEDPVEKLADPELNNLRALQIIAKRFVRDAKPSTTATMIGGDLRANYPHFINGIVEAIAITMHTRVGSASVLEKLQIVAPSMQFKLVTNVENAAMVPHRPVVHSSQVWRTIKPSEFTVVQTQSYTPVRLQGVIMMGTISTTQVAASGNKKSQMGGIVGAFRVNSPGRLRITNAPGWMYFQPAPDHLRFMQENAQLVAQDPNLGQDGVRPDRNYGELKVTDEQMHRIQRNLGCDMARMDYFEEALKHRQMTLVGRLRFDIAPGSAVQVVTHTPLQGKAGAVKGWNTGRIYGNVDEVEICIDTADPKATTTLRISHVRDAVNGDQANKWHPMYPKASWYGSPLVKLYSGDMKPDA